jgi:glycogen synthase
VAGSGQGPEGGAADFANVRRLGQLPYRELAEYMRGASIFVLPAKYEPFGLAELEAGLAGCALVVGDIPTLREVWEDSACFVDPDDEQALELCLKRLIADSSFRNLIAAKARKRAMRFTTHRMGRGYLMMYEKLLEEHAHRYRVRDIV